MSALAQIQPRPDQPLDVRRDLARTAGANAAAHDAQVSDALAGVTWRRTGILGRLQRDPR